jgi:pyruvate/2-oxoglutarate/acetoin dehydrogenase E1 component
VSDVASKRTTLSRAFRDGLAEEMARDQSIVVMGTDLFERGGHWAQVTNLGDMFGRERVRNTPISEAAMVAAGVGAALNGLRPVVDLNFLDFAFGAMDEIVNQAAKARYWWGRPVPLVVRGTTGFAGGGAQHNNPVESWFCHVPGLLVAYPSTAADAKGLIKTALRGEDPVIFCMHKMLTGARGEAGGPEDLTPFGRAAIRRPGNDVTVLTYLSMVAHAAAAIDQTGVDAELIDLRFLDRASLDWDTVGASIRKTSAVLIVEQGALGTSYGGWLADEIQRRFFDWLDQPVQRVTGGEASPSISRVLERAAIAKTEEVAAALERVRLGFGSGHVSETVIS